MGAAPIVLVLGPHRSGTSATTRVLSLAGCALPPDLMPPHPDNPTGYWEPQALVELHDALLASLGSNWSDPRALPSGWSEHPEIEAAAESIGQLLGDHDPRPLAVKDPRLCRLVPMWHSVLRTSGRPGVAVCVARPAEEVIASLVQRDGFGHAWAALIWLRHVVELEAGSRSLPRAVVPYPQLLDDWRSVLPRVAALPGLGELTPDGAGADAIDAFLDRRLRRQTGEGIVDALPRSIADAVRECERAYGGLAADDEADRRRAVQTFTELGTWLAAADPLLAIGVEAGLREVDDAVAGHERRVRALLDDAERRVAEAHQARDREVAALRRQLEAARLVAPAAGRR